MILYRSRWLVSVDRISLLVVTCLNVEHTYVFRFIICFSKFSEDLNAIKKIHVIYIKIVDGTYDPIDVLARVISELSVFK